MDITTQEVETTIKTPLNPWVRLDITISNPSEEFWKGLDLAASELKGWGNFINALPGLAFSLKQSGLKYRIKLKRTKGIFTYLASLFQFKMAFKTFEQFGKEKYEEKFKK